MGARGRWQLLKEPDKTAPVRSRAKPSVATLLAKAAANLDKAADEAKKVNEKFGHDVVQVLFATELLRQRWPGR